MKGIWILIGTAVLAAVVSFTVWRFFSSGSQRSVVEISLYVIYVLGGITLLFVPFDRTHSRSRWAQGALVSGGLLLVFVGLSELLRHYHIWVLPIQTESTFAQTLTLLQGTALGLFVAVMLSGELVGRKIPRGDA